MNSLKLLRRPAEGRMVAGVAAGLARYFGVDATVVRVGLVLLAMLGGSGLPLYLACWLLIPADGDDDSVLSGLSHKWSRASV